MWLWAHDNMTALSDDKSCYMFAVTMSRRLLSDWDWHQHDGGYCTRSGPATACHAVRAGGTTLRQSSHISQLQQELTVQDVDLMGSFWESHLVQYYWVQSVQCEVCTDCTDGQVRWTQSPGHTHNSQLHRKRSVLFRTNWVYSRRTRCVQGNGNILFIFWVCRSKNATTPPDNGTQFA